MYKLRLAVCFIGFIFLLSCSISQWTPPPLPSRIEGIEGHASLRIKGEDGEVKSKFSFLFQLPNRGRIDVSALLGKTLYQIFVDEKEAFLVIPSERIYWQGDEEEIIDRFFGFRLSLDELVSLLSGQWSRSRRNFGEEGWLKEWILENDKQGRIVRGNKGDLMFEVKDFFKDSSVVRLLIYRHPLSSGRLKILAINFNQPIKKGVFSFEHLKKFKRKTWAEIEEILNEKN